MSKLNQSKENLSQAFIDLEAAILDKIDQAKNLTVVDLEVDKNNQDTINNFHNEINFLQKELAELGMENETLRNFKSQAGEVVGKIKIDLAQIKKIINQN